MYVCIYMRMNVYIYVNMCVCMYIYIHTYISHMHMLLQNALKSDSDRDVRAALASVESTLAKMEVLPDVIGRRTSGLPVAEQEAEIRDAGRMAEEEAMIAAEQVSFISSI